jgi:hypothetical protein
MAAVSRKVNVHYVLEYGNSRSFRILYGKTAGIGERISGRARGLAKNLGRQLHAVGLTALPGLGYTASVSTGEVRRKL